MSLPYKVRFKLPLEFLTLQDWNNFVQNLLFINQYGPGKLLQYYQNGNFQNLNDVIAKYLYVSALKAKGYNVLHNLSQPQAYTFGEGNQQPFKSMANKPIIQLKSVIFPILNFQIQLSKVSKQLQLLIPKVISKIVTPNQIAGTQFQFSGTANVQTLIEDYLDSQYLQTWREIIIQNLGSSAVQINNSIYLMPKNCLKITASSPSEIQLTAQTPTLLSEEIEFVGTPITTYTITITNNQADPTPSPFQQLLNLNLSSILSSSSQLLNLQFCLDVNCNTPLYAWIESYTSDLSSIYIWINLPTSIPANSSITIYMFIRNSIQYPYTGMRPDLSASYAQYDNGKNIFLIYFNGNEPLSNFNNQGNSLTQISTTGPLGNTINAIYLSGYNSHFGFVYTVKYISNQPVIAESSVIDLGNQAGGLNADNGFVSIVDNTSIGNLNAISVDMGYSGSYFSNDYFISGTQTSDVNPQGSAVSEWLYAWVVYSGTSSTSWYGCIAPQLYSSSGGYCGTVGNNPFSSSSQLYLGIIGSVNSSYQWQTAWNFMRLRAYPPNGTMPSNSQPQKTIILVS
ncbi:hypothetical protein CCL45_gp40 [Sulfolobus islandicus rod-shaped virus 5]|uniref:DUF2341 domain-containing protein n=2 Tax=Usarudivirus SIRV5 TaxID=2846591 RepID=A0A1X9SKL8_9VIRU|nr:hypothetical protein CCL43_gp38 [Sulfolobus islandicus rod-shaped virus 7]YP_009362650.1 hypothetical protein CCL45_gp40 [Sulfolobus islandicus rod-shaped virus 5]YP_009362901.1 hypothetical protein CCL44_gp39 [Sulfolobus islandicus rod-shaped phage 6]ARQ96608.1 hypothetical protein [Sulfolobus islandicus rod-shaped virus 7]ARQ96662.1 hypothetical protein [Sulfolobus islandicus rod-shaped virus 5]ARQ96768.1 hypothetical protein [Sulfolobus islandicus rod-shaped phage 6]